MIPVFGMAARNVFALIDSSAVKPGKCASLGQLTE